MQWAVGVTTSPRPQSTLDRTLASLQAAGWSYVNVFNDTKEAGAWSNWIRALGVLIDCQPDAQAYLMVQDDAVFCRNLRAYLEGTLWPAAGVALCSPYCPTPYAKPTPGWHEENNGWNLVGAVCWAILPDAARQIVRQLGDVDVKEHIDAQVGQWAQSVGRSVWYHTPSLVQHVGCGNSARGDPLTSSGRVADDFVGEQTLYKADARKIRFVAIIQPGRLEYQALILAGSSRFSVLPPHELVFVRNLTCDPGELLPDTQAILADLGCPIIGDIHHDFFDRFPGHPASKFMGKPAAMAKAAEDTDAGHVCWLDADHVFFKPFQFPAGFEMEFAGRKLDWMGAFFLQPHWSRLWRLAGMPVPEDQFSVPNREGQPVTYPRCFQGGIVSVKTQHVEQYAETWRKFAAVILSDPACQGPDWRLSDQIMLTFAQQEMELSHGLVTGLPIVHYAGRSYADPRVWQAIKQVSRVFPHVMAAASKIALKPPAYQRIFLHPEPGTENLLRKSLVK